MKAVCIAAMILLCGVSMFSCSEEETPTGTANRPPTEPRIDTDGGAPADNAVDQPVFLTLRWKCSDPDGEALAYDVYFDDTTSPELAVSGLRDKAFQPDTLAYGTYYHWRILAKDSRGSATTSPIWDFRTQDAPDEAPVTKSATATDGATDG